MPEDRILLTGTPQEKARQALEKAGWYSGRSADISRVLTFYDSHNIKLSDAAIAFFREYYGIANAWYFGVKNLEWAPDFEFNLFPCHDWKENDDRYFRDESKLKDRQCVAAFAKENVVLVGEIGYYYPSFIYIGDSAKIYADLDSAPVILGYHTIIDYIAEQTEHREFDSVAVRRIPFH